MPALTTLGIVVGHLNPVGRLPDSIRTFSLEMRGDWDSPYWLGTLQGNPTRFHLRIIVLNSCSQGMSGYLQTLPTHLDNTRLHTLAIEVTQLPYYDLPVKSLSSLTQPLLEPLYAFSALDLCSFCAFGLNDAVYARMATMWPKLTSLKVGTSEVSKGRPAASVVAVVAVVAVLRTCPHLQTFHIVFNGSVPPPPPVTVGEEKNVDVGVEEERAAVSQVNGRGVSNQHITHVGYSPLWEGTDSLKDLASCLKSAMPRLETIRSQTDVADPWRMVQNLLVGDGAPPLRGRPT